MSVEPQLSRAALQADQTAFLDSPADRESRNAFYRYAMHVGLPVALSIVAHVALFGFLALKTFNVLTRPAISVGEYEASLVQSLDDQLDDAFQWVDPTALEATLDIAPLESLQSLTSLRDVADFNVRDIAAADFGPGSGSGSGLGEGDGLGLGDGALALLGTGGGAGEAGTGGFGSGLGGGGGRIGEAGIWDLTIRANKIVYVVDYSGSIIFTVDDLRRELMRSVGRLKPSQSFNVLLFYEQHDKVQVDAFRPKLEPASEQTRREFFAWIQGRAPQGYTKPLAAILRALTMAPDAIFFLSDGDFEDQVVTQISDANRTVRARIYGLVFHEDYLEDTSGLPPKESEYSRRLRRIAEQNGGAVKIVTGSDLSRP